MPSDPIQRLTEIGASIQKLRAEAQALINQLGEDLGLGLRAPTVERVPRVIPPKKSGTQQRRRRSPSGPLAPAVCAVLKQAGRPLRVKEIFEALRAANYEFTGSNPKRSLGVRMYKLPGVRSLGDGTFSAVPVTTAAPAPAVGETS